MKKLLAITVAALVAIIGISPASASTFEPWKAPEIQPGYANLTLDDMPGFGASALTAVKTSPMQETLCEEPGKGKCKVGSGWIFRGDVLLGVCVEQEVNCIESVSIYKAGEQPVPAKFVREVAGPTSVAAPAMNIPRGATKSIWQAEGQVNSGGTNTYAVWGALSFHVFGPKAGFEIFKAGVTPVTEGFNARAKEIEIEEKVTNNISRLGFRNQIRDCVYQETKVCGAPANFADDTRVSMTLRMTSALTGWLSGRLQDPLIDVSTFAKGYNRITVDASPVDVPMLSASFTKATFPAALKPKPLFAGLWNSVSTMPSNGSTGMNLFSDTNDGITVVEAVRSSQRDTATGLRSTWSFSSIFRPDSKEDKCLKDKSKLLGLVTTNAMAYEGNAPQFVDGFLRYQVAGMHYLPGGDELAMGSYDLVMRSDVARCLYGFTKAPVSATVSVVNDKGKKTAATTVVGEANGWLKLAAYNFTFSKKIIKIKVTQARAD